jgi:dienelactone hydrolase
MNHKAGPTSHRMRNGFFIVQVRLAVLLVAPGLLTGQSPQGETDLPAPTGTYSISHVEYHWTDGSRSEPLSNVPGSKRELMVRVWYPSQRPVDAGVPWMAHFDKVKTSVGESALRKALGAAYPAVATHRLVTHSSVAGPHAKHPSRFPLLIFSHGQGTPSSAYSIQIEELVSHGYLVAAIDHTYESAATVFPDGRVIPFSPRVASPSPGSNLGDRVAVWAEDISFVLGQMGRYDLDRKLGAPWYRRLDRKRIGAFGHSLGGRAAARACQLDERIKACLNEDGMISGGLPFDVRDTDKPMTQAFLLLMTSENVRRPTAEELARMNKTQAEFEVMLKGLRAKRDDVFARIQGGSHRVVLNVPGISHQSFSDLPFLAAYDVGAKANARRVIDLIRICVLAFFDQYLKHPTNSLLEDKLKGVSEIETQHFAASRR